MDLDPMISNSQEDYSYSDYDNRPIRPMNQEALNETLARLPILIDEEDYNNRTNGSSDSNSSSIKARLTNRRQPNLAYSTRRKKLPITSSGVINNQSLLHVNTTMATPKSNKRKLGRCTPTVTPTAHKVIKQLDWRLELAHIKEENKILEEAKANLQLECVLLKNAHETELEHVKQEHQQTIDTLFEEHKLQREQFNATLAEKEQSIIQTNLELENLRNDHTLISLEKETLEKIVAEYQLFKEEANVKLTENEITIKTLREEVERLTKLHEQKQQKQSTPKSTLANGRMPLKGTATDRPRTADSTVPTNTKKEPIRSKTSNKTSTIRGTKKDELKTTPSSSVNTSLNKSNSSTCSSASTLKPPPPKSKTKTSMIIEEAKKKSASSVPLLDKRSSLIATRTRSKVIPIKS